METSACCIGWATAPSLTTRTHTFHAQLIQFELNKLDKDNKIRQYYQ